MRDKQITRRNFLKIVGATAVVGAAWQMGIRPQTLTPVTVSQSKVLMGTVVNLTVVGEDKIVAETAVTATLDQMSQLEFLLSRHRPESELSQLNKNGRLAQASQPLLDLIHQSHQLSELSGGAFDISVKPLVDLYQRHQEQGELPPRTAVSETLTLVNYENIQVNGSEIALTQPDMSITLDGIGKGYIVDAGTAVLKEHGFVNVLVEAGGDLMAAGAYEKRPWRIGIQPPRPEMNDHLTPIQLTNQAVATSGDYMQAYTADFSQHHILDPRTGFSAPDLASVSVKAPSVMLADGLATAVMVLGENPGLELVAKYPGCEARLVRKDLSVNATTFW